MMRETEVQIGNPGLMILFAKRVPENVNIKRFVPDYFKLPIRKFYLAVAWARPKSIARHYCPVCARGLSHFREDTQWHDVRCVFCNSGARQRMVWEFFRRSTDLYDGRRKQMLHVAPEIQFVNAFTKALGDGYITADLFDPRAKVRLDVTDIQYPADFFDVIFCSHVLEHVPDDRKAMRELARVLKPQGWAAIMVPCFPERGATFEDWSVTDPAERLKVFGQADHVRIYGNDFVNRLEESGFDVRVVQAPEFLSPEEIVRFDINRYSGEVFLCTKRQYSI
jgi:SAM-dependent methyltransferase